MNIQKGSFRSIEQLQNEYLSSSVRSTEENKNGISFRDILIKTQTGVEASELKFSKHAVNRLSDRNISLSGAQMTKLENGAVKAKEKGIKESLVVVDELAFIVNIPNKTVITAMGREESQGNVFTNIDGAVFM